MAVSNEPKAIAVRFSTIDDRRFRALAEFDAKKPATLATEILRAYMDTRAADIDLILNAKDEYERNIAALRCQQHSEKFSANGDVA